jgi:AGZA family xanthine/uracil permease-like MFS transporter
MGRRGRRRPLFLSPLFLLVPGAATAPALILVGVFMMGPVREIDFSDITESVPAFLTMVMMPLAYSIAEGIVWGLISYVVVKALSGKGKEISIATYVLAAILLLTFVI